MKFQRRTSQPTFFNVATITCLVLFPILLPAKLATFAPMSATAKSASPEISKVFPETGKTISGRFLDYWQQNGGVTRFGYPVSEEIQEPSDLDGNTYTVQYFERAVFELHPENQPPFDVLLQLLGKFRYNALYHAAGAPDQYANNDPGAVFFPQTGKTVGGAFLDYWKTNGGLAQFGYPISEEFAEISPINGSSYKVQYFERAELESHPYNLKPYEVLLTPLGTLRWQDTYGTEDVLKAEFRSDVPDGQYIPFYPRSAIRSIIDESLTDRLVSYQVPAGTYDVRAFYARILPKYGWTYLYSDNNYTSVYEWTDPYGLVPWHFNLAVSTFTWDPGNNRAGVQLRYARFPDADRMPLYPYAQDVTVDHAGQNGPPFSSPCSDSVANTVYRYRTTALLPEVEDFYRSTLSSYGWKDGEANGSLSSANGITFHSDHPENIVPQNHTQVYQIRSLYLAITGLDQGGDHGLREITLNLHTCIDYESGGM